MIGSKFLNRAILGMVLTLAMGFMAAFGCGGFMDGMGNEVICTSTTTGRTGCECRRTGQTLCDDAKASCNEDEICMIPVMDAGVMDAVVDSGLPCEGKCGAGAQCVNNVCVAGDAGVANPDAAVVNPDANQVFADASASVRSVRVGVWTTAEETNAVRDFVLRLRQRELRKGLVWAFCGNQAYGSDVVTITANTPMAIYFSKSLAVGEQCRWGFTGQAENGESLVSLPGLTGPGNTQEVVLVHGQIHYLDTNEVRNASVVPNGANNGRDFLGP